MNNGYLPPAHPNPSYVDSAYGTASIPAYNPAQYGPTTGPTLPRDDPYGRAYQPHANDYPNDYPPHPSDPYAPRNNDPRNPENVSAPRAAYVHTDGLDGGNSGDVSPRTVTPGTSRPPSPSVLAAQSPRPKSVQFDEDPVESEHIITPLESPETRRHRERNRERDDDPDRHHRRHRSSDHNPSRKRRRRSRSVSPGRDGDSDATEDLPPRFDAEGHRLPERGEDPFADKVEDLLQSSFFQNMAGNLFGASSNGGHGRRR